MRPLLLVLSVPLVSFLCTTYLLVLFLKLANSARQSTLRTSVEYAAADVMPIPRAVQIYRPQPAPRGLALPRIRSSAMRI